MATETFVLYQSNPSAATETTIRTVPGATTGVYKLTVCNRSTTPTSWRFRHKIAAAGDDNAQFRYYDQPIGANETIEVVGIIATAADVLKVYATLATLSFCLEGFERA